LGRNVQERAMVAVRGTVRRVRLFMPLASRIAPIIIGKIAIQLIRNKLDSEPDKLLTSSKTGERRTTKIRFS